MSAATTASCIPNEHVNMSQSTNDVYPTALKIATYHSIFHLVDAMAILRRAFERKSEEFADIIKMGRTQLQDAVPMTLGQEFSTYAVMVGEDEERLKEAALLIREINMGATAIGTGITSHPDYAALVCKHLCAITGLPLLTAPNLHRSHAGLRLVRAALRRPQAGRRQDIQDLQ